MLKIINNISKNPNSVSSKFKIKRKSAAVCVQGKSTLRKHLISEVIVCSGVALTNHYADQCNITQYSTYYLYSKNTILKYLYVYLSKKEMVTFPTVSKFILI